MKILNLIDEINRSEWLVRFYEELLIPNFSQFPNELDSLNNFYNALNDLSNHSYKLYITLIVEDDKILAGASYEYYLKSKSVLLTYIVVSDSAKGKGLSKLLMSEIQNELKYHHKDIKALFAESNSDNVDESKDVMNPTLRRIILNKLGFRYLDFEYIQPPLSKDLNKCEDLILSIHKDYISSEGVKKSVVLKWLEEFWENLVGDSYLNNRDWLQTKDSLRQKKFINLQNNI